MSVCTRERETELWMWDRECGDGGKCTGNSRERVSGLEMWFGGNLVKA